MGRVDPVDLTAKPSTRRRRQGTEPCLAPVPVSMEFMRPAVKECVEDKGIYIPVASEDGWIHVPVQGLGYCPLYPFDHDNSLLLVPAFGGLKQSLYYERKGGRWFLVPWAEELRTIIDAQEVLEHMKRHAD